MPSVWDGGECNLGHRVVFLSYLRQSSRLRREYINCWEWLGLRWMAGTSPGVFHRVCLQCVRVVLIRFRLAVGSPECMMAGLPVTL